jgi:hypothetical protein
MNWLAALARLDTVPFVASPKHGLGPPSTGVQTHNARMRGFSLKTERHGKNEKTGLPPSGTAFDFAFGPTELQMVTRCARALVRSAASSGPPLLQRYGATCPDPRS